MARSCAILKESWRKRLFGRARSQMVNWPCLAGRRLAAWTAEQGHNREYRKCANARELSRSTTVHLPRFCWVPARGAQRMRDGAGLQPHLQTLDEWRDVALLRTNVQPATGVI